GQADEADEGESVVDRGVLLDGAESSAENSDADGEHERDQHQPQRHQEARRYLGADVDIAAYRWPELPAEETDIAVTAQSSEPEPVALGSGPIEVEPGLLGGHHFRCRRRL